MFISLDEVKDFFRGKTVSIVGGGPSSFAAPTGKIDEADIVVRVNNYILRDKRTGKRADVLYSFFGTSIGKTADQLKADGVKLCLCKCPDGNPINSAYHSRPSRRNGVDYRYIYKNRKDFWFCDTYIPTQEEFLEIFNRLDQHQPTTGFACLYTILNCDIKSAYITGFDFFQSDTHFNSKGEVIKWGRQRKNMDDPFRHEPDLEAAQFRTMAKMPWVELDDVLRRIVI